jgi:hemolysin D
MKKIDRYDVITENENCHQKIRILIVDDQNFVRKFLQHILETEQNFQIVGTANNGQDAIIKVASLQPDLVLIDLEMPEMDGLTATGIIARKYPQCKILVLTSYKDSEHLQKALHAGANGYLLKDCSPQEIPHAVYSVAQGYTQLSPGLLEKVLTPKIQIVPEAQREGITQLNFLLTKSKQRDSPASTSESTTEVSQKLRSHSLKSFVFFLLITTTILIPVSILTKVDRVVTIQGKLVAKGETITLDAPIKGTVVALEVKEGEKVTQGQSLIQIESPSVNEQLQQQQQQLINLQNQLANLDFFKNQQLLSIRNQQQQSKVQELEKQLIIEQLQQSLESLKASYNNLITEKYAELKSSYKAIATTKSAHQLAKMYRDLAQAKVNRYQKNEIAEVKEAEKTLKESQINFNQTASKIEQVTSHYHKKQNSYNQLQQKIDTEIQQATLKIQEQEKNYQTLLKNQISAITVNEASLKETEAKIVTLQKEIAKNNNLVKNLKSQLPKQTLHSPVDGVVSRISIKKPGIAVEKKQNLVRIFPETSPLVFQGKISNQDSHLLQIGLPVKLKINHNLVSEESTVSGRLSWISSQAKTVTNSETVETKIKESVSFNHLDLEVELEQNYIQSQKQQIFLTPEEIVTAEITLKQRPLITLLLDLFLGLNI